MLNYIRIEKVNDSYAFETCAICGETFRPKYVGQKYCSDNCFDIAEGRRKKPARIESKATFHYTKKCRNCGEEFETNNPRAVICKKCILKEDKNRRLIKKTCPLCKREFEPLRRNQKYCSRHCYQKYVSAGLSAKRPVYKKKCVICGKEFETRRSRVICCSKECSKTRCRGSYYYEMKKQKAEEIGS